MIKTKKEAWLRVGKCLAEYFEQYNHTGYICIVLERMVIREEISYKLSNEMKLELNEFCQDSFNFGQELFVDDLEDGTPLGVSYDLSHPSETRIQICILLSILSTENE